MDLVDIAKGLPSVVRKSMSASLAGIAKAHPALERMLGEGLAVRGTTASGIKRMARGEMPYRLSGTFGPGVYTTNTVREAAEYREGVKGARLAVFRPNGKPMRTYRSTDWNEDTWLPEDLGKPVHVQNINRSTAARLRQQEMGGPRADNRLKPMTPVSQLSPGERADRLERARYRRRWRDVEGFSLADSDRAPWNRQ